MADPTGLRLVTWNLAGLDEDRVDERCEAAVFTLLVGAPLHQLPHDATGPGSLPAPDVIVLQEVTARMLQGHLGPHLAAVGYHVRPAAPPDRPMFELIAVRSPWTIGAHSIDDLRDSQFGRLLHRVAITNAKLPGAPALTVLTGHLDSGPGSRSRALQIAQVVAAVPMAGVFAGDMNIRATEWEDQRASASHLGVRDAWELVGSPDTGRTTWRGSGRSARFDRVLVGSTVSVRSLSIRGDRPIGPDLWISDHVAVCAELELEANTVGSRPSQPGDGGP